MASERFRSRIVRVRGTKRSVCGTSKAEAWACSKATFITFTVSPGVPMAKVRFRAQRTKRSVCGTSRVDAAGAYSKATKIAFTVSL